MNNEILVIDLGNGYTAFSKNNETPREFPSWVAPAEDDDGLNKVDYFNFKGTRYRVGDQCFGLNATRSSIDSSFYSSEKIQILFAYCMTLAYGDNRTATPIIVTSLPAEHYTRLKDQFKRMLHTVVNDLRISASRIVVLPQNRGPFYDPLLMDSSGNPMTEMTRKTGQIGCVDIGRGSIDGGLFINGRDTGVVYGASDGTKRYYEMFEAAIKDRSSILYRPKGSKSKSIKYLPDDFEVPESISINEIDAWFRRGKIPFDGREIELTKLSESLMVQYSQSVLTICLNDAFKGGRFLDGLIIAGGGADLLGRKVLEQAVKPKLYIPKEARFSALRGLGAMARYFMETKSA